MNKNVLLDKNFEQPERMLKMITKKMKKKKMIRIKKKLVVIEPVSSKDDNVLKNFDVSEEDKI